MLSQNKIIYRTSTLLVAILSLCLIYGSHSSKKKKNEDKIEYTTMLSRRSHQHGIRKAKKYDRSELLGSKHQEKTSDIIPLVQTYNPKNQNITPIIHQLNNIFING